jgi:transposase
MHKRDDVLALVRARLSFREIEERLGVRRETVSKYARAAGLWPPSKPATPEGVATGSPLPNGPIPSDEAPAGGACPPPSPPAPAPAPTPASPSSCSACEEHREWIAHQVRLGRNAQAIYQQLVDDFAFTHRYNSVKRFVRALKHKDPAQFDRLEFLPGEEAQVDYGQGAPTRDERTGRYRTPRLFVMTLRYSRRAFRKVVWNSSQEVFARLHEEAFRYFGGCTQYVVLDNLKEGVLGPDIYEPVLNPLYASLLKHHGVVADPARVRDPDRKGSVENAIQHTQATALKGRRFETLEEQNAYLMAWEEKWAAPRVHGRAKRQVQAMFEEERPHLLSLPQLPFRFFKQEKRTVWDDGLIQVGQCYYAALPAPLFSQVWVRIYDSEIEILDPKTMRILRRHRRLERKGEMAVDPADRIFNPSRETERLMKQASSIGEHTARLCQALFRENGRVAQKRIQGIVALSRKHSAARIEEACRTAYDHHAWSCRAVRLLIEKKIEMEAARDAAKPAQQDLLQTHESIRPIGEYQAFWDHFATQAAKERGEEYPWAPAARREVAASPHQASPTHP